MPGGARKYVEMDERDEAARPRQAAETDWFRVLTFGCAPRCKRPPARPPARPGLPGRAAPRRGRGSARVPALISHHTRPRRHLNPLLETGYSRPIVFDDMPPLVAEDRADSVRQVRPSRARALLLASHARSAVDACADTICGITFFIKTRCPCRLPRRLLRAGGERAAEWRPGGR